MTQDIQKGVEATHASRCLADIERRVTRLTIIGGLLILPWLVSGTVVAQQWVAQGARPNTRGQVENIEDREVVGSINTVAVHPTNPNIIYVGAVNGGIWRTANAMAGRPSWVNQTDDQRSLFIGAIEFDPIDSRTGRLSQVRAASAVLDVVAASARDCCVRPMMAQTGRRWMVAGP